MSSVPARYALKGQAIPTQTARARPTRSMVSSSMRPNGARTLSRRKVIGLSTMICETSRRPLVGDGSTVMRNCGALRISPVNGNTVKSRVGLVEQVGLNDQRRARLSEVAGQRHGDDVATPHERQSSLSCRTSSSSMIACSAGSPATSRDCRRHSAANAGERVSGPTAGSDASPWRACVRGNDERCHECWSGCSALA